MRGVGPARHRSSETEEEMEKEGQRERSAACAIILVPLQQKCNPSCTSTMPAQNDRGYCTPNHCVVGRERET